MKKKSPKGKTQAAKSGKTRRTRAAKKAGTPRAAARKSRGAEGKRNLGLRLMERRRHPRFLLSREQFREVRGGKTFPVYDLSMTGLSVRVDDRAWPLGGLIQGVLNLHPESIEVVARLVSYYGDRAALRFESASTYARSVLARALSPRRLGLSLQLIREKLPLADYWYHGVCNTDVLLRLNGEGAVTKAEIFFSNAYWSWTEHSGDMVTGMCQSIGEKEREAFLSSAEPVKLESISLAMDSATDLMKVRWAKGILEAAPIEPLLKQQLLQKFDV